MSISDFETLENEVAEKPSFTDKCDLTTDAVLLDLKNLSSSKRSLEKVQNFLPVHKSSNDLVNNQVSLKNLLRNRLSSQYMLDDHSTSLFCEVDLAFPKPAVQLKSAYKADKQTHKINLGYEGKLFIYSMFIQCLNY